MFLLDYIKRKLPLFGFKREEKVPDFHLVCFIKYKLPSEVLKSEEYVDVY